MRDRPLVTYPVPFGAIAQLVERFHGMEEVRSSLVDGSEIGSRGMLAERVGYEVGYGP